MTEKEREKKENEKLQKRFGEHLVKLRNSKGLIHSEFARRCDMESSNLASIENGRGNPTLRTLKKLALALDMNIEEFMKGFKH